MAKRIVFLLWATSWPVYLLSLIVSSNNYKMNKNNNNKKHTFSNSSGKLLYLWEAGGSREKKKKREEEGEEEKEELREGSKIGQIESLIMPVENHSINEGQHNPVITAMSSNPPN